MFNVTGLESSFLVGSGGGRRNQGEVQGAWREREERNTGLEVVVGKWPEPLGGSLEWPPILKSHYTQELCLHVENVGEIPDSGGPDLQALAQPAPGQSCPMKQSEENRPPTRGRGREDFTDRTQICAPLTVSLNLYALPDEPSGTLVLYI
ncbi:UNVERIFIED_CONTAM: hypothetical protein FKN15_071296 [Acipenser sinensis]